MAVLEVNHITKKFKTKLALQDVSCSFTNGITALLGPNGAGKSTLMNIMCSLLPADEGVVKYNNCDIKELKAGYLEKISMQFQSQPMYRNYTGEEYLAFCGALKGISKQEIKEQGQYLLEYFGIETSKKKRISTFSGGMKQRLALCGTFLGNPEVIFLDEPSAGLDIYEREELKKLLCEWKTKSIIIVSTHIVSDIENIADDIVLLNEGKVHSIGTQKELIDDIENCIWEIPREKAKSIASQVYHSDGKSLCFSKDRPCPEAILKPADLTDVYFSCLQAR